MRKMTTLAMLEEMTCDTISVKQVSEVLHCAPVLLRDGLDLDEDRPDGSKRYRFPHCKVGNRHHISRIGFINWMKGCDAN